jgi:heme oxygenase
MQLSLRLKQATREQHAVAERSGLMPHLLGGKLSPADYAVLLRNLQAIYAALEQGLASATNLPEMDFTPLYRSQALAQDLAFLAALPDIALCPAAQSYVERLQALAAQGSELLLAHAYVRYLGDLHGGQMLRRCVARLLQATLPGDVVPAESAAGLQFYDFGSPERVAGLIAAFRSGLDHMPLNEAQAEAMAQEAHWGFARHVDMFRQLPHATEA